MRHQFILNNKAIKVCLVLSVLILIATIAQKPQYRQQKTSYNSLGLVAGATEVMVRDTNNPIIYNTTASIEASFNTNDNENTNDKHTKDTNTNDNKNTNDKNKNDINYDIKRLPGGVKLKDIDDKKHYCNASSLNVREYPDQEAEKVGVLKRKDEVVVTAKVKDSDWVQVEYNDNRAFVHKEYIVDSVDKVKCGIPNNWKGPKLNPTSGTIVGPSGKETYYNLPMTGVVNIMKRNGYNYDYWVREDGAKMYGDYIMVAANLNVRPRGSIVQTSLGQGIVCDTGEFAKSNPYQLDICTVW